MHISHTDTTPAIKWTITNGTPLGPIDRDDIDIVAGQTGQVIVIAEVRIGETCVTSAKKRVDISEVVRRTRRTTVVHDHRALRQ